MTMTPDLVAEILRRKRYFHCLPAQLAPGSIIEPGNFGRIIRAYTTAGHSPPGSISPVAYRELIFDLVRKLVAPKKPSRLNCVFACPTEEELRIFMSERNSLTDIAYEVEATGDPVIHLASHDLPLLRFAAEDRCPYFEKIEKIAQNYWTGTPPAQRLEVLIGGAVRVVRRL